MKVNEESLGFGLLVGQKKQPELFFYTFENNWEIKRQKESLFRKSIKPGTQFGGIWTLSETQPSQKCKVSYLSNVFWLISPKSNLITQRSRRLPSCFDGHGLQWYHVQHHQRDYHHIHRADKVLMLRTIKDPKEPHGRSSAWYLSAFVTVNDDTKAGSCFRVRNQLCQCFFWVILATCKQTLRIFSFSWKRAFESAHHVIAHDPLEPCEEQRAVDGSNWGDSKHLIFLNETPQRPSIKLLFQQTHLHTHSQTLSTLNKITAEGWPTVALTCLPYSILTVN